jgi:hypothetical protein
MAISTKTEMSSKEKIAKLREKHQPIFDSMNTPNALFFPKMAYRPSGKDELYVSFFASELKREGHIFTEFVGRDYVPEDGNRTLWMWTYNPHWDEEYETTEPNDVGHVRYLVPVSELTKVSEPTTTQAPTNFFEEPWHAVTGDDAPIKDMTIRDFATIMTGRPLSTKQWLNTLITQK